MKYFWLLYLQVPRAFVLLMLNLLLFSLPRISSPTILVDRELMNKLQGSHLKINLENGTKTQVLEYKAFWCKKQCFIWDETKNEFSKLIGFDKFVNCSDLNFKENIGLSREEQILRLDIIIKKIIKKIIIVWVKLNNFYFRRIVYGNNEILIPVQSVGVLFILEVLNPFYIFQIFTLAVWLPEGYIYYAFAIACMSIFGIFSSIIQTRKVINEWTFFKIFTDTFMIKLLLRKIIIKKLE